MTFNFQCEKTEQCGFIVPTDLWNKFYEEGDVTTDGHTLTMDGVEYDGEYINDDWYENIEWDEITPKVTDKGDGTSLITYEITYYLTFPLPKGFTKDWEESDEYEYEIDEDCCFVITEEETGKTWTIEPEERGDEMTEFWYWESEEIYGSTY